MIVLAIIGATGPVMAAILSYKAKKSTKVVIQTVNQKLENSLGPPNGHGSLMNQTEKLLNNQLQIQQNVYELNEKVTDHIDSTHDKFVVLHDKFDSLSTRIKDHVDWEENGQPRGNRRKTEK